MYCSTKYNSISVWSILQNTIQLSQEKIHRDADNRSHPALPETTICYTIPLVVATSLLYALSPRHPSNKLRNIEHCLCSSRHSYNVKHLPGQIICPGALRVYIQVRNEKYRSVRRNIPGNLQARSVDTVKVRSTDTGPLYCDACPAIPAQSQ